MNGGDGVVDFGEVFGGEGGVDVFVGHGFALCGIGYMDELRVPGDRSGGVTGLWRFCGVGGEGFGYATESVAMIEDSGLRLGVCDASAASWEVIIEFLSDRWLEHECSRGIEEAVSQLAEAPFDAEAFPFAFLEAFGNKKTTIKKLKSRKNSSNKSDLGGVLQRSNIHLKVCPEAR